VAGLFVLAARITEANDKFDGIVHETEREERGVRGEVDGSSS
jgi:hypothetical protein